MRKLSLIVASIIIMSAFLFSCEKDAKDTVKVVELIIYPETSFKGSELSDIWGDALVISDSEDAEKRVLDNITEGFDYSDYERGYQYTYKVKKVWMHNPPQDVSSIKYIFMEQLSKKKVITENSEKDIQLYVLPQKVEYSPWIVKRDVENGMSQRYDALHVKNEKTGEWMALIDIEGFDFEAGFEYVINVSEMTKADPYSKKYTLLNVVSKEESEKKWPGVVYGYDL